jgi:hypothetical protein
MSRTLDHHLETFDLALENYRGNPTSERITGNEIAVDELNDVHVYLTEDEHVIVYDGLRYQAHEIKDDSELRDWLDSDSYAKAMDTLERKAGIHL